jgi:hypothetical protein
VGSLELTDEPKVARITEYYVLISADHHVEAATPHLGLKRWMAG